ncbi:MAG TPA: phosphatidate cytidylyltransferase [Acidimicrobiales bacterium]|nr:phosphatidate cytidylyltransferase [Acidimicrobiales bacterium]
MDQRPFRERPDDDTDAMPTARDRPGGQRGDPTEGVRIIGDDEAAEVMERGDVAPRRGMGTPKYGDRPEAPPEDARPALRFPLSAGGDASEVARPRVSGSPAPPMQPWTEPPSGEVPVIVPEAKGDDDTGDDLEAWSSFATSGPRWRDQSSDWEKPDYDDTSMLHDDETRVGALDTSDRPGPDDFFSFDEYDDEVAAPPPVSRRVERPGAAVPAGQALRDRPPSGSTRMPAEPDEWDEGMAADDGGGSELRQRVLTAAVLTAAALIVFALGPGPAVVLVTAVVAVCAGELFDSLRRGGYQPATLLGLVASVSMVAAAYWKGEVALPLVLGLTVVFTLLWYLVGVTRVAPTMNLSVTVFGVAYVGLLGSFAALILAFPNGIGVLIGVVVAVAAADAGALFVGQRFGRRLLAPDISPNKTVEGVAGGGLIAVVVSWLVLGVIGLHPWEPGTAVALGLVVAVAAPLGDLCQSMLKRDLELKDMGSVLPGHGGLIDRFDALLFVLPAAYYLCRLLEIF